MTKSTAIASTLALCLATAAPAQTQMPSCAGPEPSLPKEPILLDTVSARIFGDMLAEQGQKDLRVLDEPALTGELTRIGDRVRAYIPNLTGEVQYLLLDAPMATAFGFVGGRIFLTRRMIAFVRTEDELGYCPNLPPRALDPVLGHDGSANRRHRRKDR